MAAGHHMHVAAMDIPMGEQSRETTPRACVIEASESSQDLVPQEQIDHLLLKYKSVFPADLPIGLPPDRGTGHTIVIESGHTPPFRRNRRLCPSELEEAEKHIKDLLEKGYITPSTSPYGAPIMFVPKKNGGLRVVCDWRALNKITVKRHFPIPRIDEILDRLAGARIFSSLDLASGYFQVRISEEDAHKTAFTTPFGHYEFKVLGQGLCNSPATFQSIMSRIFAPLLHRCCLVYMDDVVVFSRTPEEHVQHLDQVLKILEDNKFYACPKKCVFNQPKLEFLGHVVGRDGLEVDQKKVKTVQDWPVPQDAGEIRSFVGLTTYFRKFIQGYSSLTAPLTALTNKGVDVKAGWRSVHTDVFNALKEALVTAPVLALPDFTKPFEVISDASLLGTGAILMQEGRVIAYTSKKFSSAEKNYTTGEQELLGVVNALTEWRCYLEGGECKLVTDHNPLVFLQSQPNLSRRQARWMEYLSRFHYTWEYRPGRLNVADPVSRNPNLACMFLASMQVRKSRTPSFLERITSGYAKDPLFDSPEHTAKFSQSGDVWLVRDRIVVPADDVLRRDIMAEMHATPYSGHVGATRTYESIARSFIWFGMRKDIKEYVLSCHQCQVNKSATQKPAGLLTQVEVPERPWECVSMDLITSLPVTKSNNDAIVVFVDKLTKMTHFVACRTELSAEGFADLFFQHVHKLHGVPRKFLSDRDSRFTGQFLTALCAMLGTRQSFSTSFHPQTDGQTERMNRVLQDMLRHYTSPYQDDWDTKLASAEFAVNNAWQESVQNTPFFLNYGQHPFTPVTLGVSAKVPSAVQYAQNFQERIAHAKTCLQAARDRQKAYADTHRRDISFSVGDDVLLCTKNIKLKSPGTKKLMPKYIGPFKVTQLVGPPPTADGPHVNPVAVKLALPPSMRIHNVFHVSLVKPYRSDGTVQPPSPLLYETDGSHIWEVQDLIDTRQRKIGKRSVTEYLVRWARFGPEHDSWEPSKNILDKGLISAYRLARTQPS
jgi:hypothetical protein